MSAQESSVKKELKSQLETKTQEETKAQQEAGEIQNAAQLRDIVKAALQSEHPLLKTALKQERAFRARTEQELQELLTNIRKMMSEKNPGQIKKAVLEKMDLDLELVNRLNTAIADYKPKDTQPKDYTENDKTTCTYPLKFNKMALAIPGAQAIVKAHFEDIFCKGILPKGYAYHSKPEDITILGNNPNTIYGDSKGTFLKTAAYMVHLVCSGKTQLQDAHVNQPHWIDNTAMAHVTHIPTALDLSKLDARFEKFSYLFHDETIPQGMIFVHSGYSFGGQRDTKHRYQMGSKALGPEDCSSWISKLTGSPIQFSTIDQLYSYRLSALKTYNLNLGIVPSDYASGTTANVMGTLFEPVVVKDPQKDIRPGQIYIHRGFDRTQDPIMQGPGKGGHTGIVLNFISAAEKSSIAVLAYDRNMPNEEGFGIEQFPVVHENRKVMLFSLKSQDFSLSKRDLEPKVLSLETTATVFDNKANLT